MRYDASRIIYTMVNVDTNQAVGMPDDLAGTGGGSIMLLVQPSHEGQQRPLTFAADKCLKLPKHSSRGSYSGRWR